MILQPTPHRRRIHFSLATLLILVVVLSIPLAWYGYVMQSSQQELAWRRWTQKELAAMGGDVSGWSFDSGASHLRFFATRFDEAVLERLQRVLARNPYITDVYMERTEGTDRALDLLRSKLGISKKSISSKQT